MQHKHCSYCMYLQVAQVLHSTIDQGARIQQQVRNVTMSVLPPVVQLDATLRNITNQAVADMQIQLNALRPDPTVYTAVLQPIAAYLNDQAGEQQLVRNDCAGVMCC